MDLCKICVCVSITQGSTMILKEYFKQILNEKNDVLIRIYPLFKIKSLVIQKSGRVTCHFSYNEFDRIKVRHSQIAKLLLEIDIGRRLIDDETVDHIDGDCTNNDILNLQILSSKENSSKGSSKLNKIKNSINQSKRMLSSDGDYCRGENNSLHKLSEEEVMEIKEIQKTYIKGSGQDKILAEKYNVTRGTIKGIRLKYIWKHIMGP